MNNSNWTGRTSRTMNDAFGAHCRQSISEPRSGMTKIDKQTTIASLIALAVLLVLMATGVV